VAQRSVEDKLALLRHHDDGVPWTRIAAQSGVPLRPMTRWSAQYRADPTSRGVQRPERTDRGTRRIAAELVEAIEALALRRPEPTAAFGDPATSRPGTWSVFLPAANAGIGTSATSAREIQVPVASSKTASVY